MKRNLVMNGMNNENKVFCQSDSCKKTRYQFDEYVAAYKVLRDKAEELLSDNKALKAEFVRVVESSRQAVLKARIQQKNSKERAARLAAKLKRLEGAED